MNDLDPLNGPEQTGADSNESDPESNGMDESRWDELEMLIACAPRPEPDDRLHERIKSLIDRHAPAGSEQPPALQATPGLTYFQLLKGSARTRQLILPLCAAVIGFVIGRLVPADLSHQSSGLNATTVDSAGPRFQMKPDHVSSKVNTVSRIPESELRQLETFLVANPTPEPLWGSPKWGSSRWRYSN